MKTFPRKNRPVMAYVLGFGFAALAGHANASCLSGLAQSASAGKASTPTPAAISVPFVQAVYRPGQDAPAFLRIGDRDDNNDEPIVGLWQFVLNDGMDFGTQAWHADGTEFMISAGRDPSKGDVCQGVWRRIGPRTYTLNHIAMGWDQGFGQGLPLVRVHLHMTVKVDRSGRSFSGSVSGMACLEYDLTMPFLETDQNCQQLPPGGSIVGTWVQAD